MKQKLEGFTGAAGAEQTPARTRAPREADGRMHGEGAIASILSTQSGEVSSGGEAAAFRLEKRTYSNTNNQVKNRITLRNYGNGLAEIGWSFVGLSPTHKAARGSSIQRTQNEDRAARRAKSRLRQLVLGANLNHLLTLTYRDNVTDFNQASDDLNRFVRKMKFHLPDWLYVAVAEQQERGAWHWHLAVRGRQNVELLRTVWREIVGEGNIDVSAPKGTRKDQRLYLVQYLGKYLVKAFATGDRKLNKHRFRSSRNIQVPMECFSISPRLDRKIEDIALDKLRDASGGSVGFVWDGKGLLAGWACSW
ncbi:MAG: hypothetical protein WC742_15075 [Gallionellaceae bacterium]|jgi:hypothetical protein